MSATLNAPSDLVLGLCVEPGKTCLRTGLMLARVLPGGMFELLSTAAWARVLGYPADELNGKWLHDLMSLDEPAASEAAAALLDERDVEPLDITLRCKDQQRKSFRFHRRFDPYDHALFVLADEV